ncbi:hypothetical protein Daus18300_000065 [Diaporthe australafricana]|uniref:Uncharacterized protein n=1 Tax=Diaporthe australafricana TaxID=127596 RepID=A0ABR3Y7Z2_9PEZI
MYSALDDSDVEEQPRVDRGGNRNTQGYGHGTGTGAVAGSGSVSGSGSGAGVENDARHQHGRQVADHDEEQVLSPTDGYFGRSGDSPTSEYDAAYPTNNNNYDNYPSVDNNHPLSPPHAHQGAVHATPSSRYPAAASSQVPHVPDVWVSDPSLEQGSTAESKAREAQEERELNRRRAGRPNPSNFASLPYSGDGGSSTLPSLNSNPSTTTFGPGQSRYAFGPGLSSAPSSQRYTPSSSTAAPSRSHRSGTIYSERSSLFSEAPPAYTPSPTSPTTAASSSYQTFQPSNMGRISESESRGLLASHEYETVPQDMGGQADDDYTFTRTGNWRDRVRSRVSSLNGRTCKLVALGVVLLFVTIGFLVSSFIGVKDEDWRALPKSTPLLGYSKRDQLLNLSFRLSSAQKVEMASLPRQANSEQRRIHVPGGGSGSSPISKLPAEDDDGTRLAYPPYDGAMPWAESDLCATKEIKYPVQTFKVDFSDSRNVSFFQDVKKNHPQGGRDVRVSGEVVVRRAGNGTPGPAMTLEIVSNDDLIELDLDWDDVEQRLYVLTPLSIQWPSNTAESPCLQIRATLWAPPGSVLDSLNVESVHLGVKLLDNLSIQLNNFARLASTIGTVVAATDGEKDPKQVMLEGAPKSFTLNSRYIEVKTLSNAIAGSWPLYDYLGLETVAGSIRAGVQPKEALKDKPRPAILYVHSTSGAIELHEPVEAAAATLAMESQGTAVGLAAQDMIPPRQYGVDLYTMSGTIKGSVAFSHSCKIHTTSGNIDLTLLPVYDKSQIQSGAGSSALQSSTTSGTTVIKVMDALWKDIQTGAYVAPPAPPPPPPAVPGSTDFVPIGSEDPYSFLGDQEPPAADSPPTPEEVAADQEAAAAAAASPAIRMLNARHSTTSAAIRLTYPAAWEGGIDADSLTGKIGISGKGVEIIRRDDEFPGFKERVLARKGPDGVGGNLKCHTTSGAITVAFPS